MAPRTFPFTARLLGRHQLAAALATAVDFGLMTALVALAHVPPPAAAFASALAGGVVNFSLSRGWAFRGLHGRSLRSQALRYVVVCVLGALANASLLALVLRVSPLPYLPARALVAVLVSLFYTYPAHVRFVFDVRVDRREGHSEAHP